MKKDNNEINIPKMLREIDAYIKSHQDYKMSPAELKLLLFIFGFQMQSQNIPQSDIDEYVKYAYRGAAFFAAYK